MFVGGQPIVSSDDDDGSELEGASVNVDRQLRAVRLRGSVFYIYIYIHTIPFIKVGQLIRLHFLIFSFNVCRCWWWWCECGCW